MDWEEVSGTAGLTQTRQHRTTTVVKKIAKRNIYGSQVVPPTPYSILHTQSAENWRTTAGKKEKPADV